MKSNNKGTKGIGMTSILVIIVVAALVAGGLGYFASSLSPARVVTSTSVTTAVSTATSTVTGPAKPSSTVDLTVIPDFGGSTYDAFVVPSNVNGTNFTPPNNTTAPAHPNNNVTVQAGVPIRFVISNIDSAILGNFSGKVNVPFAFYNATNSGEVAVNYGVGSTVNNLPMSHTFTISTLGINIPLPASTITTFSYTFTKPGVYVYVCMTPCGPGMGVPGYMMGYVIVTS